MEHFKPFQHRKIMNLPTAKANAWTLKRYAILAENREFDEKISIAALDAAFERLPLAGTLENPNGNHGIGFQLIHYAEVAVVSPIFYWMLGSVLGNTKQMRAQWDNPTKFDDGVSEIVGCAWELELVSFEMQSWTQTMLTGLYPSEQKKHYLNSIFPNCIQRV